MGLNQKQQEAVEYLNGPLLVLAGPGTGKTQLLSAKVAYILETTDALPENILCLTFTDAGANNMRERLLSIVGPAAGNVNIHTYHAFGSDILSMYKNYAENFDRNLDDPIDSVTQFKIIKNILDELPVTDILKTSSEKDIIATISEAKSARLTPDDLLLIAKTNIDDTEKMNPILSDILKDIRKNMPYTEGKEVYLRAGEVINQYASEEPIVNKVKKEANAFLISLNQAILEEEAKEKPSISGLTKWRNSLFEKDKNDNYRLKNYISNKKLLSLANVYTKYEKYLEDNHLFDFTDMVEQAVRMLQEDDGFRYTLQERYQYILLDEFQDTNPSQYELIRLISAPEKPDIMAVGDDDQAIFAFQGADVSNILDFQSDYNAHLVVLTENYRSTSEILDISRKIADKIEGSFVKLHNGISDNKIVKNLTSVRNDEITGGDNTPKVIRHEFLAADSEYAWVANQISDLINSGVKQSDIAIITPKHKYITPLLPYLKSHENINISYEKRENILEDEYISQLNKLARFIYELSIGNNPSHMLLEILTFPFLGISAIDAITALKSYYGDARGALDYLKDSENEKLKYVATFLAELVAKSFDTPLELFLNYLTGTSEIETTTGEKIRSNFLDYYTNETVDFKTYNLYENLTVLREQIVNHIKNDKPRLKDFIDFLDDYEAAGELILNTSPYQDSSDSIQIMTAYKSKGLEFEHVFIVATDDLSWGNSKGNNNKLTLPKNLEMIRHTGQTEDECLRLFFVALTRAKKTITMTNSKQDFSGKSPKRLEYLEESEKEIDGKIEVTSPLLVNTDVIEHYEDLPEAEREDNLEKHWISSYMKIEPNLRSVLEKNVENFTMNASALTTFIDIVYAGPVEFYKRYIINGPSEPASDSMQFGTLVHAVFENVTNKKLSDEEALEYFKGEVEKLDLTDAEKKDMLERGELSVKESLAVFRDILAPEKLTAKAEVNLYAEHLTYNGIPITGKIDHINIDEENKTIEIYDFKTGGYHKEKWESHPTLYKYTLQLLFYKLLLNMSPTYSKYKVTRAHILFVSPNPKDVAINNLEGTEADLVHDKIYEFTDDEEKDFKDLLIAVYKHIKSLDFIDEDSPLAVFPDDTRKIKDIKDFVEQIKNIE